MGFDARITTGCHAFLYGFFWKVVLVSSILLEDNNDYDCCRMIQPSANLSQRMLMLFFSFAGRSSFYFHRVHFIDVAGYSESCGRSSDESPHSDR